ncbi:MAG TPA: hypothetical protein VFI49_05345 [Rudaea sp.]|nr:hypothetical protein [Rudaea sp.]
MAQNLLFLAGFSDPKPDSQPSAMLVLTLPPSDHGTPRPAARRRRNGVVWQPHYEGFASVAYQSGRAVAGISGPWSGQYVLIWWEQARPIRQVELFESLEEAKQAVAEALGVKAGGRLSDLFGSMRRESAVKPLRSNWWATLRRWLLPHLRGSGQLRVLDHRRRHDNEETDLSGLNIRAVR